MPHPPPAGDHARHAARRRQAAAGRRRPARTFAENAAMQGRLLVAARSGRWRSPTTRGSRPRRSTAPGRRRRPASPAPTPADADNVEHLLAEAPDGKRAARRVRLAVVDPQSGEEQHLRGLLQRRTGSAEPRAAGARRRPGLRARLRRDQPTASRPSRADREARRSAIARSRSSRRACWRGGRAAERRDERLMEGALPSMRRVARLSGSRRAGWPQAVTGNSATTARLPAEAVHSGTDPRGGDTLTPSLAPRVAVRPPDPRPPRRSRQGRAPCGARRGHRRPWSRSFLIFGLLDRQPHRGDERRRRPDALGLAVIAVVLSVDMSRAPSLRTAPRRGGTARHRLVNAVHFASTSPARSPFSPASCGARRRRAGGPSAAATVVAVLVVYAAQRSTRETRRS